MQLDSLPGFVSLFVTTQSETVQPYRCPSGSSSLVSELCTSCMQDVLEPPNEGYSCQDGSQMAYNDEPRLVLGYGGKENSNASFSSKGEVFRKFVSSEIILSFLSNATPDGSYLNRALAQSYPQ